jgi:hypothetical protein
LRHTANHPTPIDWHVPPPKRSLDRLVGPGATPAELAIQFVPTVVITLAWLLHAHAAGAGWSPLQTFVAALLATDMIGGVITNATGVAKRYFHRPGQGFAQHLGFVALHAVQPLLLVTLFDPGNVAFAAGSFGLALAGAFAVLAAPPYLQRPVAGASLAAALFVGTTLLNAPAHFAWFLPVYLVKLLWSHLVREEPYRPAGRREVAA